ncbi:MAG TPA: hypothetical protein VH916_02380 [Dehalococcoidia bacterium]|jgi:uncharacterized protein (DUF433 family)
MNRQTAVKARRSDRWIVPNPHKPEVAEAWVLPKHVSVWVIVRQLEIEGGQADVVADVFDLPIAAVDAARAYYEQHRAAIDERIARNRAFFAAR